MTTSSSTVPTVTSAWSAIWPQVSSATVAAASSAEAKACVAPNFSAVSRLNASGSTATTFLAPGRGRALDRVDADAADPVDHGGVPARTPPA